MTCLHPHLRSYRSFTEVRRGLGNVFFCIISDLVLPLQSPPWPHWPITHHSPWHHGLLKCHTFENALPSASTLSAPAPMFFLLVRPLALPYAHSIYASFLCASTVHLPCCVWFFRVSRRAGPLSLLWSQCLSHDLERRLGPILLN